MRHRLAHNWIRQMMTSIFLVKIMHTFEKLELYLPSWSRGNSILAHSLLLPRGLLLQPCIQVKAKKNSTHISLWVENCSQTFYVTNFYNIFH